MPCLQENTSSHRTRVQKVLLSVAHGFQQEGTTQAYAIAERREEEKEHCKVGKGCRASGTKMYVLKENVC